MPGFKHTIRAAALYVTAALSLLLSGCASALVDPAEVKVPGLLQLLEAEPRKSLDLFVAHGMCHHDKEWAVEELERIAHASGGRASELKADEGKPPGISIYSRTIELPQGNVRAHALVWSGLTKPLKDRLCYDRAKNRTSCEAPPPKDGKPYPHYRDLLNRLAKETLVDDCFSDAVVYLGKSRNAIQARFQEALAATRGQSTGVSTALGIGPFRASQANTDGVVVLSSSLGSKLVFDAIHQMSLSQDADKKAAGTLLWSRMRGVFMAANQIPLLSLSDEDALAANRLAPTAQKEGEYAPDPLAALLSAQEPWNLHGMAGRPPLPIVAFSDPNDLLSFSTRPYVVQFPPNEHYQAVDVLVRNAWSLGLIANPVSAHTGYLDNPQVLKVLFHGINGSPEALKGGK